jgi:hypothetical protein
MPRPAPPELAWIAIDCPHCGERYDAPADPSGGSTSYVEDCAVCCRPIVVELVVDADDGLVEVRVRREQD